MKLVNNQTQDVVSKPEIEAVQKQKQEYKLIEQYIRTRGLRLYAYDSSKDKIIEIKPKLKDNASLEYGTDGVLKVKEQSKEEIVVDSRWDFFECLNIKNAEKRVDKFKKGKIKDLCNLIKKSDVKPIIEF